MAMGIPARCRTPAAEVLIGGHRCPLLGRVTMDQIVVDVSGFETAPQPGDEVVLFGSQDGEQLLATELAEKAGTIPWEILTESPDAYIEFTAKRLKRAMGWTRIGARRSVRHRPNRIEDGGGDGNCSQKSSIPTSRSMMATRP